jgi:putative MFS transporter
MFGMEKAITQEEYVIEKLEETKVGRKHYKLLALSGLGWLFDSMDILILSYVIAAMVAEKFVGKVDAGLIASSNNLGLFFGALLSGLIADKWGRKKAFQITLVTYSVFSFLSAFSWNSLSMDILRFFTGFGLGGELPVVSSLLSEFIPSKQRGRFVVLLESFWAYGGLIAALVAYIVIPTYGWRIALMIGALPALYVWVLRRSLPESPRYLVKTGKYDEAIKIVSYFGGKVELSTNLQQEYKNEESAFDRLRKLWSKPYRRRTVMLWILWFGIVFGYYGAFIWLPGALNARGFTLVTSIYFSVIITAAQIPGYFLSAYLIERIGRKAVLSSFLALSALFATLFAFSPDKNMIILWGSLMSFFNLGAWGAVYAYTPENYPTDVRGTGSGSAAAFGRIGGIIAPYAIALALGMSNGFSVAYSINAFMFLVAALLVVILGRETMGKTLEQASGEI